MVLAIAVSARSKENAEPEKSDLRYAAFYAEAQRHLNKMNFDAAYELLTYCKKLNPSSAETLYHLATLNMYLGNDSAATSDLAAAVELAPDNYWYPSMLAKVYLARHRPAEATKVLEKMDERWKFNRPVLYMLKDAYASQSMLDSVMSVLLRLETKEGKSDELSLEKIGIYTHRNDVSGILDEMESLVKATPSTDLPGRLLPALLQKKEDAFSLLGEIYQRAGNYDRSFQYYDSCLVYNPDDAMALNNYAYYLALQETRLDTAEVMSRKSNELEPDNPTYLDTLAWILYLKGNYTEANRYIERTLELMKPDELMSADDVKEHVKKIKEKLKK